MRGGEEGKVEELPMQRRRLGKVEVIRNPALAGSLNQSKQRGAFGDTGSAPDQDNEADMRFGLRKTQKVAAVAGNDDHTFTDCITQCG